MRSLQCGTGATGDRPRREAADSLIPASLPPRSRSPCPRVVWDLEAWTAQWERGITRLDDQRPFPRSVRHLRESTPQSTADHGGWPPPPSKGTRCSTLLRTASHDDLTPRTRGTTSPGSRPVGVTPSGPSPGHALPDALATDPPSGHVPRSAANMRARGGASGPTPPDAPPTSRQDTGPDTRSTTQGARRRKDRPRWTTHDGPSATHHAASTKRDAPSETHQARPTKRDPPSETHQARPTKRAHQASAPTRTHHAKRTMRNAPNETHQAQRTKRDAPSRADQTGPTKQDRPNRTDQTGPTARRREWEPDSGPPKPRYSAP